jgi:hypothetical protein
MHPVILLVCIFLIEQVSAENFGAKIQEQLRADHKKVLLDWLSVCD